MKFLRPWVSASRRSARPARRARSHNSRSVGKIPVAVELLEERLCLSIPTPVAEADVDSPTGEFGTTDTTGNVAADCHTKEAHGFWFIPNDYTGPLPDHDHGNATSSCGLEDHDHGHDDETLVCGLSNHDHDDETITDPLMDHDQVTFIGPQMDHDHDDRTCCVCGLPDHAHNHDHEIIFGLLPDGEEPTIGPALAPIGTAGADSLPEPFLDSGWQWPQAGGPGSPTTITYSFSNLLDGGLGGTLSAPELRSGIEEAFGLWAQYAPLNFVEMEDNGPPPSDSNYSASGLAQIRIGHEYIDGASGANVLAHAFYPSSAGLGGDIHFDNSNTWRNGSNQGLDFLEVAVHEIGHALGLGHEPMPSDGGNNAIMNPYYGGRYSTGLGSAFLLTDDINGIRAIYGSGVGSVTPLGTGGDPESDDHGDDSLTATVISLGTKQGEIESGGDEDWFRFHVSSGQTYIFESSLVTLPDTKLTLLNSDGVSLLGFDDDSGEGLASRLQWTATFSGPVFVVINAFNDTQVGRYSLSVTQNSTGGDDHGNSASQSTVLTGAANGDIETAGDVDWFQFTAQEGFQYTIETALGTLPDSTLTLYDSNGVSALRFDDDGGEGRASKLEWTAIRSGTFYVELRGFSNSHTGTYSVQFDEQFILQTPQLASPLGTIHETQPEFRWSAVPGAGNYEIRVVREVDGAVVVQQVAIDSTSYTPTTTLSENSSYRWQVRAHTPDTSGSWSGYGSFNIAPIQLTAPNIQSPIGMTYEARPSFEWTEIPGAERYDIWVNDLTTGTSGVIRNQSVPGSALQSPMELVVGHDYLWTVRALRDGEAGPWAVHRRFTASMEVGRPRPLQVGDSTIDSTPQFSWTPVQGAARYDLWVNNLTTGESGIIREIALAGTTFVPTTPFSAGHHYIWTVRAINAQGIAGAWSPHFRLSVLDPATAAPPSLLLPRGEATGSQPTFAWTVVPGADRYDLWVNDLTTGESGVIREMHLQQTEWTATTPLVPGHRYLWTVRAITDNNIPGRWGGHRDFEVAIPPFIVPEMRAEAMAPTVTSNIAHEFGESDFTSPQVFKDRVASFTSGMVDSMLRPMIQLVGQRVIDSDVCSDTQIGAYSQETRFPISVMSIQPQVPFQSNEESDENCLDASISLCNKSAVLRKSELDALDEFFDQFPGTVWES